MIPFLALLPVLEANAPLVDRPDDPALTRPPPREPKEPLPVVRGRRMLAGLEAGTVLGGFLALEAGSLEIRADIGWPILPGFTAWTVCSALSESFFHRECAPAVIASSGRLRFALPMEKESAPYFEVGVLAGRAFQSERWAVSPLFGAGWRWRSSDVLSVGFTVARHFEPLSPGDDDLRVFVPVVEGSIGFAL